MKNPYNTRKRRAIFSATHTGKAHSFPHQPKHLVNKMTFLHGTQPAHGIARICSTPLVPISTKSQILVTHAMNANDLSTPFSGNVREPAATQRKQIHKNFLTIQYNTYTDPMCPLPGVCYLLVGAQVGVCITAVSS